MYRPYAVIKNATYTLRRKDTGTTLNISKDGGAFAAAAGTPVETPASSGIFVNTLAAIEMECDHLFYKGNAGNSFSDGVLIPEPAFDSGILQAASSNTATLRPSAPSADLTGLLIEIVRGTGKDQRPRVIMSYDGTSKVATVRPNWSTTPSTDSIYIVTYPDQSNLIMIDGSLYSPEALSQFWNASIKGGTVGPGSSASVIQTDMTGYGAQQLKGAVLQCLGANNYGICRAIQSYNSSTGEFTVFPAFASAPTAGDAIQAFGTTG